MELFRRIYKVNVHFAMRRTRGDPEGDDVRDIVENLISGMSLARVPEDIHPRLLVPLSAAKNEAIVAGNTATVKRIQTIMRELHLHPTKTGTMSRASSRASARSAFVTTRSLREEKKDDMDKTIDELIDGLRLIGYDEK